MESPPWLQILKKSDGLCYEVHVTSLRSSAVQSRLAQPAQDHMSCHPASRIGGGFGPKCMVLSTPDLFPTSISEANNGDS